MGYLRLLRQRPILLLWVAQTLSVLGDRLYALAVMWLVWEITHSAALMGAVAVVESLPYVVMGAFGGRVLARFTALGRLAAVDAGRMLVVAALPVVWVTSGPSVGVLLVVAAVLGVLGSVFDPNLGALVPDLVEKNQVQQVSGLMDLMGRIARVAGPASAGVLLVFVSDVQLYLVDAATFAMSAASLAALARRSVPLRADTVARVASEPRRARLSVRGLLRTFPATGAMIGVHGAGQLFGSVGLVLPVLLATRLHAGASMYASCALATGIGALAANAVAGNARWATVFPGGYCLAWMVSGLVLATTGLVTAGWQLLAVSVLAGMTSPFAAIALRTHMSRFDRAERLPLMTLDQTALRGAGLVGTAALPALATGAPAEAYVLAGVATVVVAGAGWVVAVVTTARFRMVPEEAQPVRA